MSKTAIITTLALAAQTMYSQPYYGERIDRRDGSKRFTKKAFKERMRSKRARKARKINREKS